MNDHGKPKNALSETHTPRAIIQQLNLFKELPSGYKDDTHANTIALWDIAPVWHLRQPKGNPPQVVREFRLPGTNYQMAVDIRPAHLVLPNGKTKTVYPTEREMMVEEALRMLASSGEGGVSPDMQYVTCRFTLEQLRKAFRSIGKDYSAQHLRESIEILRKSSVTFIGQNNGPFGETNFLPQIYGTNFDEWQKADTKAELHAFFHPLVSHAIRTYQYRLYDWKVCMSLPDPATRYLYKRFTHYIKGASSQEPTEFIITGAQRPEDEDIVGLAEESGFYQYTDPRDTIKRWKQVAEDLKSAKLLMSTQPTFKPAQDGKPAKLVLHPSPVLLRTIIEGNVHAKRLSEKTTRQKSFKI